MEFDWWTLALQTVNFAVLVWVLQRFLYKPVLKLIDARRAEIDGRYAAVHEAEAKARAELEAIGEKKEAVAAERAALLKAAAAEAESSAEKRRAEAERSAAALLDSARKTIATEREQAVAEMRRAALDLGAEIARRLLAEVPVELRAEAWLERVEGHLAELPASELDRMVRTLNGATLRVITAPPLPEPATAEWRARLERALGDGIAIEFEDDPALVAGAELHFPQAILRFSWRDALSTLRAEIETREGP
jgi:F-type H+-transporting ATPase subunit b